MFKKMTSPLQCRLVVGFVVVVIIPMVLAIIVSTNVLRDRMTNLTDEKGVLAADVGKGMIAEIQEKAAIHAHHIAAERELRLYLSQRKYREIRNLLPVKLKAAGANELTLTDGKGAVIGRGHLPEEFGDDLSGRMRVKLGLRGRTMRTICVEGGVLLVGTTIPIVRDEVVDGILAVDYIIDQGMAERMKKVVGADVTFFMMGKIVASTIVGEKGKRLTTIPDSSRVLKMLEEDGVAEMQLKLFGEFTESRFSPLKDPGRRIVGMLMTSTPITEVLAAKAASRNRLISVGVLGILFATLLAFSIARRISIPVRDGSVQMTSVADQILLASEREATGLEKEAAEISQTAISAKQLAATAKQATNLGNEIAKSSASSVQMANSGSVAVGNVVSGAEKIRQSVSDTARRIEGLGERSQAITEILTLIEDVTDQTNLLSLNAAIEAARAGEAGNGFSVVADAIGKLADRTTKSTKNISGLIKGIQQDTSFCIMSMEESTKETEEGACSAREAGNRLKEIVSAFEHVAQLAKEIASASQQQTSGNEQIARAMTVIDEVMRQSANGAKQSTEAARGLVNVADQFRKLVG